MSRLIGCETARERLDGFVDGELAVDEQVIVEAHLRSCRSCALHVEDLRLIGTSVRAGSSAHQALADDAQALGAIYSGVLMRIRAEQELSLGTRLHEMFSDMRLLWPALGATTALVVSITTAGAVFASATEVKPESLAEMIETLAQPGTERNPLRANDDGVLVQGNYGNVEENRPTNGISLPRGLDDSTRFEGLSEGDAVYALSTVVNSDGRVASYDVLSQQGGRDGALADAVLHSRFQPAQTALGSKVTVSMVWLIISTKAVTPAPARVVGAAAPLVRPVPPPLAEPSVAPVGVPEPDNRRSSTIGQLTTA